MGDGNSATSVNNLVHNHLLRSDYDGLELIGFNALTLTRRFGQEHFSKSGMALKAGDGWKEDLVQIRVPCTKVCQKESEAPEFAVEGICQGHSTPYSLPGLSALLHSPYRPLLGH